MAEDKTKRIRELIGTLRAAGRAYELLGILVVYFYYF